TSAFACSSNRCHVASRVSTIKSLFCRNCQRPWQGERYLHPQYRTVCISPGNPAHDLRLDHRPESDHRAKSHRSSPSLYHPHSSVSPCRLTWLPRLFFDIGKNRIGMWHLLERLALDLVAKAKAQTIQDHRHRRGCWQDGCLNALLPEPFHS